MVSPAGVTNTQNQAGENSSLNYNFALISLTSLFFMWGFITCLNDILIPHLKNVFDLSYSQAMLIQFCFFGAYFLVSMPAGVVVKKIGYQKGIVLGLLIASIGCGLFYPAASLHSYPVFLAALFVLASGVTVLQVSANPYVSILGDEKTASSRLTLTQAFNSLGTTIAPFFGGLLILGIASGSFESIEQQKLMQAQAVQMPYLLLASSLLVLSAIFAFMKLPQISEPDTREQINEGSAWQYKHLVLGAIGIFVYVGAEVGIGSFLINFMAMDAIAGLEESKAAHYLTYFWGGAMVGRFIGAAVMQKIDAGFVLFFNACCAILLLLIAILASGSLAMWAVLLIGLCNSIMFPTIFSLALRGLKQHTSQGSGILCLAIVGGAIIPLLQGFLADVAGVQISFILPLLCFVFIAYYGLKGSKS